MRLQVALQSFLAIGLLASVSLCLAEDPVVVVYSDPSLTRLEKEIGVTPAQKARFDDIVVKYRDQSRNGEGSSQSDADANSGASPQSGGRQGRGRGGGGRARTGSFTNAKGANLRQEMEELATILTPEQLEKFKELNQRKAKQRSSPDASGVGSRQS
jgi:Spy/CpxP family protein refolding chaperone